MAISAVSVATLTPAERTAARRIITHEDKAAHARPDCYSVKTDDDRELVKMPCWVEHVGDLPGGRLLVEGISRGWKGDAIPAFYTVDPTGHYEMLSADDAEALGAQVHTGLR